MSGNAIDDNYSLGAATENKLKDVASNNFASITSVKPMGKYLSGARCVLKINGRIIGFAFAISWNIRTTATEINTIDDYMPYEIAPQRIQVTGTISGFRIPGSGPTQQLIQSDIMTFMHQRYIEIEVRDSQTDNLLFYTNKAMITDRSENIRTDALAEMSLNFIAIGWADERSPKQPDDVGKPIDINGMGQLDNLKNKIDKVSKIFK